ncbi:unnamed protein product [Prunus armeniaca]
MTAISGRTTEHWALISTWIVVFDSGWIGCICAEIARQHLQLIEFSWKLIQMLRLAELLIKFSHGEAFRIGRIKISLVWTGLEVAGLAIAGLELYFSTYSP